MSVFDNIMYDYDEFYALNGKEPNELHIPTRMWDEFEKIMQESAVYWDTDIFAKVKHWWFMGMRVFIEIFSFGCSWSEQTERLKEVA